MDREMIRSILAAVASIVALAGCVGTGTSGATTAIGTSTPAAVTSLAPSPGSSPSSVPPSAASSETPLPIRQHLAAGSCNADKICIKQAIEAWRGVAFTPPIVCNGFRRMCQIMMDVYAPAGAGPWPLVVILPGGGIKPDSTMTYLDGFALQVADRGAVVMTANWRQTHDFRGGYPQSFADAACAIGVARATASTYGADPARVVLVGHSLSVWPVSVAGLSATPFAPAAGECNATAGPLRPDAVLTVAGLFDVVQSESFVPGFLGGERTAVPANWAATDPSVLAALAKPAERIPFDLAQGGMDDPRRVAAAPAFHQVLLDNGWPTHLIEVATADHYYILFEQKTIDDVLALTANP